ncbi:ABC transporter substrate-binding protein [Streptomyces chartreusis]
MPGHRTKGFCASAAALALCALPAGCAGSGESVGGGKVVLRYTWWGNPDRAERTEQALALFEKQHPDVQVQTSFSAYDAYKQKLATRAAGGDAPDVMQLDYRQIDQYASGGVLPDLGEQKAVLCTDEIDAGLLATGRLNGTQYAVPQIGACAMVAGLRACARPESLTDWRTALRRAARDCVRDLGGSGLVLLVVATAALCAWMLPLAFLAPGPLALALTAVDVRRDVEFIA